MHSYLLRTALLIVPVALSAATIPPEPDLARVFNRMEVQIPMRDGIKLYTDIYIPEEIARDRFPFLLTRTPYGATSDGGRNKSLPREATRTLLGRLHFRVSGYPRQVQIRGQFVMLPAAARQRATRRRSMKAPTPTTPSRGFWSTFPITTGARACWESRTAAG